MFGRVTIGASDADAGRGFYATVLAALGTPPDAIVIAQAGEERPVTTRLHIGFAAPSHAHVDAFWRAGVEAGFRDDGAPGPRPEYGDDYYGGFLLDPDGNSAEAVVHDNVLDRPGIDHLWVRVADLAAARRFYAGIAPICGFAAVADAPGLTRYRRAPRDGSFTLVGGEPTTPFHLAFAVGGRAAALGRDPDGHTVEAVVR